MTSFSVAYRTARAAARAAGRPRRRRTPVLVHLGHAAGRLVGIAGRAQTAALQLGGFGLLTAAAWLVGPGWGLAAAGASLLVLDLVNGDR